MFHKMEYKKYDIQSIGNRIANERKLNGFKSQDALCDELHISRNTLSKLENGQGSIDLQTLIKLCELFDCDVGYLLCEYNCKRHDTADIHEVTALSEKAIENIINFKSVPLFGDNTNFLNNLLEDDCLFKIKARIEEIRGSYSDKQLTQLEKDAMSFSVLLLLSETLERGYGIKWHL